ncbi:MAG: 6-phosphogluconolactonase [Pseudomonadota bacterium]
MIPKPQITIKDTPIDLARTAADIFSMRANECVAGKGLFFVAISGGTTPGLFHRMLMQEPYVSEIPWDKMHIFWVDERCVPENDAASNYGASKKDFLNRAPISKTQVYPMPGRLFLKTAPENTRKHSWNFFT